MTIKKKQKDLVLKGSAALPRNIELLLSAHTWSGKSGLTVDELFPDNLHVSDILPATFWGESGLSRGTLCWLSTSLLCFLPSSSALGSHRGHS